MRHAYLIIAHNEPEVLATLLACLDDERNDIYLHIDRRSEEMRQRFAAWQTSRSGFFLLESREVYWGDVSQMQTEFRLFRTAHSRGGYAYYHLLSGVDLPLKSQDEIHAFFQTHSGKEFVSYWEDERHQRDLLRKVRYHYLFTRHLKDKGTFVHALTAPVRNLTLLLQKLIRFRRHAAVDFKKGSNWVSITTGFCDYLLTQEEKCEAIFRRTLAPDEIFLQTILHLSPFADNRYRNEEDFEEENLRKIDWKRGHPYVWQEKDFEELMASPAIFARKFVGENSGLLNRIKERVCRD